MLASHTVSDDLLRVDQGSIVTLTLNRPSRRNALSIGLLHQLRESLDEISADASVRVVVVAGAGPAFCAGHDLGEMVDRSEAEYRDLFTLCSEVMLRLREMPQPVIARVHGLATAAGCQLVAACDLAVASEVATFATPGVKIGLFCSTPAVPLVRAVPAKAAMEMLLTGRPVSADQALAWGLINRVVPADRLDEAVADLAGPIVAASPMTVRLGKAAFYGQRGLDERQAYDLAAEVMTYNSCQPDAQEGMAAFLAKRPPQWKGE
jgi:enoyl-CoA hydratase/carnithine racemase